MIRKRPLDRKAWNALLWPSSREHVSPMRSAFVGMRARLKGSGELLARDGAVPLLWFFRNQPEPGEFTGKLWVERDLAHLVPPRWRASCGLYWLRPRVEPRASARPGRKLLITGLISPEFFSLESLDTLLGKLPRGFSGETLAYLPFKLERWHGPKRHEFPFRCLMRIAESVGTRARALSWQELDSIDRLDDFIWLHLNEKRLCADDFLIHFCLSRGARPSWPSRPAREAGTTRVLELSPHHCLELQEKLPRINKEAKVQDPQASFYWSQETVSVSLPAPFPWPNWFGEWARGQLPPPA